MNAKPLIYIGDIEGDVAHVKVYPGDFLGGELFKKYRAACQDSGAAFSAVLKANVVRIEHLPGLLAALGAAGFAPRTSDAVKALAEKKALAVEGARDVAHERLAQPSASRLFPFQREGVPWLAQKTSAILGDQMGCGKTPQALLAAGDRVVVLCPASLKGMWAQKTLEWRPDLMPRIVDVFDWPAPGELVVTNYERLPLLPEEVEAAGVLKKSQVALEMMLADGAPKGLVLIADEAHYLKNSKSIRTKRFRALSRAVRKAGGRTYGLSGTPMPNRPMDLLNVLQAFDLLKESFGSYPRFIELMSGRQDYWGKWTWGPPKPAAAECLKRVMLRRRLADVMPELPTAIYEDVIVELGELPSAARQANEEARAAMVAAGISVEDLAAGKINPAVQDSVFRARRVLAEALAPKAVEILDDYLDQEEPLIVFSAHARPVLAMRLPGVGIITGDTPPEERTRIVDDFQAGRLRAIAATLQAGSVGLTLTRAAHVLIVDEAWTPDVNDQAVGRVLRIGQTRGVLVKRIMVPGTVFEDVRAINEGKRVNIAGSVDRAAVKTVVDNTAEQLRMIL